MVPTRYRRVRTRAAHSVSVASAGWIPIVGRRDSAATTVGTSVPWPTTTPRRDLDLDDAFADNHGPTLTRSNAVPSWGPARRVSTPTREPRLPDGGSPSNDEVVTSAGWPQRGDRVVEIG